MKKLLLIIPAITAILLAFKPSLQLNDLNLVDVLNQLGEPIPKHDLSITDDMVKRGKDLILNGRTTDPNGKLSKQISIYFPCTSCHNTKRENPDLSDSDNPEKRLEYVAQRGQPFLQGTTFWGIVNRESWYNGDYYKKYGDAVKAANDSLRLAIQLCAIECAQGRPLEKWEEDAILAYFWTLQLKVKDLDLPSSLYDRLVKAYQDAQQDSALVRELKEYYPTKSGAHFQSPLLDKQKGYDLEGDVDTGAKIYKYSCRNCHNEGGVSDYLLDYAPHTFKHLKKHMFDDDVLSIYHIIRKGTYATPGARPYMPHYPLEKMSDRQLESLRLYIEKMAE